MRTELLQIDLLGMFRSAVTEEALRVVVLERLQAIWTPARKNEDDRTSVTHRQPCLPKMKTSS